MPQWHLLEVARNLDSSFQPLHQQPPLQASGYGELTGIVGNTYLETLGFDPSATTRDIGVLVGFYGAFVLLCLVLMQLRVPSGRAPRVQQLVHRTKSLFQPAQ